MFNYHRFKYFCLIDTSINNINLNTNDNLLNDNSRNIGNSNWINYIDNNINNKYNNTRELV